VIEAGWAPLAAVAAGLAVSPLAAGWTAALTGGQRTGWWRPRMVARGDWLPVAAVITVLVLLATAGTPPLAWWLFTVGGAVLAVVDARIEQLPARLVYPLGAAVTAVLIVDAVAAGRLDDLLRAAAAATVVGGCWLAVCFLAPRSTGLGDARLATLTSGVLGFTSWTDVGQALLLTALLAGLTAAISFALGRRHGTVPMGPAIILGALLALWM
jgi:leader peptidase (prepilin peptidase)/N-methyltransferase